MSVNSLIPMTQKSGQQIVENRFAGDRLIIATALACADQATPELVSKAVSAALDRTGSDMAQSVLLFLGSEFAHLPHAAVVAASRTAGCLNVTGCTAAGIFTEEDWILDRPAVAAMVFTGTCGLSAHAQDNDPLLTLTVPNTARADWLAQGGPRFGVVSTDAAGQGPGRIWCHGKMMIQGSCETSFAATRMVIGTSRGVRILGAAQPATCQGRDLLRLGDTAALHTLLRQLPQEMREEGRLPLHLISAGVIQADVRRAIEENRFSLIPLLAVDHDALSVTLAQPVAPGALLFWTVRQAPAAQSDMLALTDQLATQLGAEPDFGLLFSCLGRGPWFFGDDDRDLAIVKARFPGMPLIGAYGGGQIAPLPGGSVQLHNTVVLALCASDAATDASADV